MKSRADPVVYLDIFSLNVALKRLDVIEHKAPAEVATGALLLTCSGALKPSLNGNEPPTERPQQRRN